MVVPKGPSLARSTSTLIHWWSPVASANRFTCSWVISSHAVSPNWVPTACTTSSTPVNDCGMPNSSVRCLVPGSAGDVQDLAGDEAGLLAAEVRRGRGDVLRLAGPLHRDGGGGCL